MLLIWTENQRGKKKEGRTECTETGRQWNNVFAVLGENFFQYRVFAQPNYQSSVGVNKDIFRRVRYLKNFYFPRNFS